MEGRRIDPEREKEYRARGYWTNDTLLDRCREAKVDAPLKAVATKTNRTKYTFASNKLTTITTAYIQ